MVLRGRRIKNFIDLSLKACSLFSGSGHLTFDPYISYKCPRLASTASKREGAKYHRRIGFLMINPTKRDFQGGWGQENHSVSKALEFLAFLRSKRLSRSSRLLRSSWLGEPMRPLRSSDSLRYLNLMIKLLETSYFVVFRTWFFSVRIMKFQVQLWHPSDLRLWRTGYVIYVKIDW